MTNVIFLISAAIIIPLLYYFLVVKKKLNALKNVQQNEPPKKKIVSADKELKRMDEVNAAIGLAIHLYFSERHDKESAVLTINRVAKLYSPWSSKIYGLRKSPR
ncbi:MAG: hypothetical protein FD122_3668 [Stygiobacter sp.]|nr:MAG: hypothetical protein FD122_3668 [Stygiobacter sp.]KAF0215004.1 MAG: hypothetical protein FD178_2024 [Ignavibacteria bacterium]